MTEELLEARARADEPDARGRPRVGASARCSPAGPPGCPRTARSPRARPRARSAARPGRRGRASSGRSPSAIREPARGALRRAPGRRQPRLPQHRDGLQVAGPGGVLDVVRPRGGRRAAGRQRVGGALVRAQAGAERARPVHGAADERVAEAEAARDVRRPDEVLREQLVERRQRLAPRPSPRSAIARSSSNGSPATADASARRRAGADSASSSPRIAAAIASGTPSPSASARRPVVVLVQAGELEQVERVAAAGLVEALGPRRAPPRRRGRAASSGESGPSVRRRTASEPARGTLDRVQQRPVGLPGPEAGRDHDRGREAGGAAGGPRARARRRRPSAGRRARARAAAARPGARAARGRPGGRGSAPRRSSARSEPGSSARTDGNTAASSPEVLGGQAAERARVQRLEVLVQGVHEQAERQLALELRGAPVEGEAPAVLGPARAARPAARSSRSRARP